MKNITVLIYFAVFFSVFSYSQEIKQITLVSKSDLTVIPFAQIYNVVTYRGSISDKNGRFTLPVSEKNYVLEIRHISYETRQLEYTDLADLDTVYLDLNSNVLPTVTVKDVKTDVLYKSLNKLIKSLRTNDYESVNAKYIYYLESEFNGKYIEQIKSVVNFKYDLNTGFSSEDFYTEYGAFFFDAFGPFVNLQTNDWLLEFDPFGKKKYNDKNYIPTNSKKVKRKHVFLQRNACGYCSDDDISITAIAKKDSSKLVIFYDEKLNRVKTLTYSTEKNDMYSFLRLNDDVLPIKKMTLDYVFNQIDQSVEFINFSFELELEEHKNLVVKGFFKKENVMSSNLYVFGNYAPSSIYEQIILNPSNYDTEIDSIFNQHYKNFDVSNKGYLSSTTDSTKKIILGVDGTSQIKLWTNERLKFSDYQTVYHKNDYYKNRLGMVVLFEDKIDVSWIFNLKKENGIYEVKSIPSIWNRNFNVLFSKVKDALLVKLKANIMFDLYEIKRIELLEIVQKRLKNKVSLEQIKREMDLFYSQSKNEIKGISEPTSKDEVESFYELVLLNETVFDKSGIDNLHEMFLTELDTIINKPDYISIIDRYVESAFMHQTNVEYSTLCFKKAVVLSNVLIDYFKNSPKFNNKQLAGYYAVLSDFHHSLGEYDKECECLVKCKALWLEGFNASKKTNFDIRCE